MPLIPLALLLAVGLVGSAWAQEPSPALKLEANKLTLQRAREATARCEEDLGSVWAQATALQKVHQEKLHELETLKREVDDLRKHLENHTPHAGRVSRE